MRDYELTILLKPTLSEKEADKEVKSLGALLEKTGAETVKKKDLEKRQLAYEIAKFTEALYLFIEFKLKPEMILQLETQLKLQDNIVRYLLVKKGA